MISIRKFRITIGSIVLVSHFLCVAIILGYGIHFGLEIDEISSKIVSALPIAGLYSLTYYRYITANPNTIPSEMDRRIGGASFITQVGIISLFCLALIFFPLYLFNFGDMDHVNLYVGGTETVFGAYIARSFSQFFPSEVLGDTLG